MSTPLDALAELVREKLCHCRYVFDRNEGRSETIRRKPQDDCKDCGGTGAVLNIGHPLFEAMWVSENVLCEDKKCTAAGKYRDGERKAHLHPEYIRRSEAESAMRLPDAARLAVPCPEVDFWYTTQGQWGCILNDVEQAGYGDTWYYALAAALVKAMRAKEQDGS